MVARIEVQSGPGMGSIFPIEEELCWIGSGSHSTIRLDGLDERALTVHFRAGQYHVINRSRHPIRLDQQRLEPNQAAVWKHRQILQVDGRHALLLNLAEDPSPAPKGTQIGVSVLAPAVPDETETTKPASTNQLLKIFIIGVSMLITLFLLTLPEKAGVERIQTEFDSIVEKLAAKPADDVRWSFVREKLWQARLLEFQGRYEEASSLYKEAREKGLRVSEEVDELEQRVRNYIAARLEVL